MKKFILVLGGETRPMASICIRKLSVALLAGCLVLGAFAELDEFTETGPGSVGVMRTKMNASIRQTNTNTTDVASVSADTTAVSNAFVAADTSVSNAFLSADALLAAYINALEAGTNNWNTAFGWGDHALPGYLTSYTETDPIWNAQSSTVYSAIADAEPGNYSAVSNAALAALTQTVADDRYVQPQVSADYLTLDREIASWEDIGVTYSNAVTLNSPITITNDSAWTGWTTTGTLTASNTIFLTVGQYLLSPVQSNGIAYVDADVWSDQNGTAADIGIYTNGALAIGAAPWRAAGGQWRVEAGFSFPGATPGIHIDSATLISYTDLTEAATRKDVSNLGVIDDPFNPTDVANMRYVDQQDTAARAYTDDELDTYAADPDKPLRGSELRLGNMWVVSPADTSGDRFIVSGGEISGSGQLIGTTNDFIISKNDYPLMSFQSASTGLYITNYTMGATSSNVTVTLNIATNGVIAAPFAEWTENLVVGEWIRISTYDTESYPTQTNGAYELTFTIDLADTMYFRAMQPIGESVATVKTDVFDFGTSVIRFRGSVDGTNRVAELSWDFTNNVFSVEVTDE